MSDRSIKMSQGTPGIRAWPTQTGGYTTIVQATFVRPNNATTYTANTAVADSTSTPTQLVFTNAARFLNGTGVILGATLLDEANQTLLGQFELWLYFSRISTITADNANWAPSNSDLQNIVKPIAMSVPYIGNNAAGAGGNVIFDSGPISIPFKCVGSQNLYGQIVTRNAYAPVALETFFVTLFVSQD